MSSESEQTEDYGEPLTPSFPAGEMPRIWYADGDLCAIVEENLGLGIDAAEMARRIVVCVNALRGVADPEAFVKAADALAQEVERLKSSEKETGIVHDPRCVVCVKLAAYRASRGAK